MKANPRLRSSPSSSLVVPIVAGAVLLTACVPQVDAPPPPAPAPSRAPPPAPAAKPAVNWRDAPLTPGDWQWSMTNLGSTAVFAGGALVMRCNLPQRTITLTRSGSASTQTTMTITTTEGSRSLPGESVTGGLAVSLPARDPLIDSMAFSRGRFAVETPGMAPLYAPSWTEVSRVIEDCR